jgi:5'(3')-deoxyribonucleotidase
MPKKKLSVTLPTVLATVVRPVATRLNRIEDLLVEMRGALDFHLKRIGALEGQVDILIEASAKRTTRVTRSRK